MVMNRIAISAYISAAWWLSSMPALAAPADDILSGLNAAAQEPGYNTQLGLPALIGRLIAVVLGIVGIVFAINIIIAGINYMTAGGEKGKVESAKKSITQSVIGIILIVAAYAISSFVVNQFATITT